ncbi:hypothetical protein EDEG_02079 [Edhazardia aedis USNM 41457]|uniref:AAA+ ATPase domain-containing protein n=1 Tax=Edhazardia aedis (strain USNM 41457) TaxID=1003232 RepID=J9D761_EDHAE|nr:hypothetical protein EDEG_02079 [Edhazardia aedis USNM 41457]|eukprot:EJW03611.1 hypothetical protein EDEG_02079 [Edhazardia aedis USNM 41457]
MKKYIKYLIKRHEVEYSLFLEENPIIKYNFMVKRCVPKPTSFCYVLKLIESEKNAKMMLSKEQCVIINDKMHGYIVENTDNTITCNTSKRLRPKSCAIVYRNDINFYKILDEINFLLESRKKINPCIDESISIYTDFSKYFDNQLMLDNSVNGMNSDSFLEQVYRDYMKTRCVDLRIRFYVSFFDQDFNKNLQIPKIKGKTSENIKKSIKNNTVKKLTDELDKLMSKITIYYSDESDESNISEEYEFNTNYKKVSKKCKNNFSNKEKKIYGKNLKNMSTSNQLRKDNFSTNNSYNKHKYQREMISSFDNNSEKHEECNESTLLNTLEIENNENRNYIDDFDSKKCRNESTYYNDQHNGTSESEDFQNEPSQNFDSISSDSVDWDLPEKFIHTKMEILNPNLNTQQLNAVVQLAQNESYKIFGPPGTGKTSTIVEIIYQLRCRNKKVLVCGPSNASIDNIMHGFIKLNTGFDFVRIGSRSKCSEDLLKYNISEIDDVIIGNYHDTLSNLIGEDIRKDAAIDDTVENYNFDYETMEKMEEVYQNMSNYTKKVAFDKFLQHDLVFATLFGSLKYTTKHFDWVIIDECCQALEIEAFCSVMKGKNFILAGDPCQLGAITYLPDEISFFERMGKIKTIMLQNQYRMPELLIRFSNHYFYNSRIISPIICDFKFFDKSPIVFIDTCKSTTSESKHGNSYYNDHEQEMVIEFLNYLDSIAFQIHEKKNKSNKIVTVGIISPYLEQIERIKNASKSYNFDLMISTVDAFQGQEKDFIIISLVRSNKLSQIGFLKDEKRMNVAITRCKKGLIIVANSLVFEKNVFYRDYFKFLKKEAYYVDSTQPAF